MKVESKTLNVFSLSFFFSGVNRLKNEQFSGFQIDRNVNKKKKPKSFPHKALFTRLPRTKVDLNYF